MTARDEYRRRELDAVITHLEAALAGDAGVTWLTTVAETAADQLRRLRAWEAAVSAGDPGAWGSWTARDVDEFHARYGLPRRAAPGAGEDDVSHELATLRADLHDEETDELYRALDRRDVTAIADALADLVYVAYGTALTYGVDLDAVLAAVHRSNLTKEPPAEPGGKARKGPGYRPPDVAGVLARQAPLPLATREGERGPE